MNSKVIIGGVVGAVVMFLLGWLVYRVILGSMNPDMPDPTPMGLVWIFIGNLSAGLLLSYVFSNWANISTAMGGAKAALIIGVLVSLWFDSFAMAMPEMWVEAARMGLTEMIIDVVASTAIMVGGGTVVGWYLGR